MCTKKTKLLIVKQDDFHHLGRFLKIIQLLNITLDKIGHKYFVRSWGMTSEGKWKIIFSSWRSLSGCSEKKMHDIVLKLESYPDCICIMGR